MPDPSVLTTEALHHEIEALRKLEDEQLRGLKELITEKFQKVDLQFAMVEGHRQEQKTDTKTAVDAALSAQKEAVREQTAASGLAIAKSEAGTSKQLEQLSINFTTALANVTTQLADLKERVGKIEYVKVGGKEAFTNVQVILGLIVVLMTIGAFVAAAGGFGP